MGGVEGKGGVMGKSWFKEIPPEERHKYKLQEIYMPLYEVAEILGISNDELLSELRSGRLIAVGRPTGIDGLMPLPYADPAIRYDILAKWAASDGPTARKAFAHMQRR